MKKIILSALGILFAGCLWAQTASYDSLQNFLGQNAIRYVGQVLYLKENEAARGNNGYQGFAREANFDLGANGRNVFRAVESKTPLQNVSAYAQLAGHYFRISDVVTRGTTTGMTRAALTHFLQAVDVQTGETCYITYNGNADASKAFNDMFIVVGYYDKMRKMLIGHSFVYTGKEPSSRPAAYTGLQDMGGKGRRTDIKESTEWTCADVAIEQGNNREVIAVLENPMYGKVYCLATDLQNTSERNAKFQTYEDLRSQMEKAQKAEDERIEKNASRMQEAIDKFGQENGTMLAKGELKEGMTKEMCRWAFGDPFNMVTGRDATGDIEQWSYTNGRYLYFRNGILIRHTKVEAYSDDTKYFHNS